MAETPGQSGPPRRTKETEAEFGSFEKEALAANHCYRHAKVNS